MNKGGYYTGINKDRNVISKISCLVKEPRHTKVYIIGFPFISSSRTKLICDSKTQNSDYSKGELSRVMQMFYILV